MKKTFSLIVMILISSLMFSATLNFQDENFSGTVIYNENSEPGKAVFARLNLKLLKASKKKTSPETKASLVLYSDEKKIEKANFYLLPAKKKNQQNLELLSGVPLSLWLDSEKNYELKVIISIQDVAEKEFLLPLNVEKATFISETIDLNSKNTDIKQNMTSERLMQIEKLNAILGTIDENAVYSAKPFIKPVSSTRMTAYCGDRRTYRYVNGKTETSLHYGNDYGVPEGTEVRSCQDGRVVLAEFRISTGWSVVIEHLPGLYSLYYHLSSLNVKEGDFVKCGELLGLSGQTGLATGPHLHWEVRLNMSAVKPEFFMENYAFEPTEN